MKKNSHSLSNGSDLFEDIKIRENGDDTLEPSNDTAEIHRGNWGNPLQFILACVGYAVGLVCLGLLLHIIDSNFINICYPTQGQRLEISTFGLQKWRR